MQVKIVDHEKRYAGENELILSSGSVVEFDCGNFKIIAELTMQGLEIKKLEGKAGEVGLKIFTTASNAMIIN